MDLHGNWLKSDNDSDNTCHRETYPQRRYAIISDSD